MRLSLSSWGVMPNASHTEIAQVDPETPATYATASIKPSSSRPKRQPRKQTDDGKEKGSAKRGKSVEKRKREKTNSWHGNHHQIHKGQCEGRQTRRSDCRSDETDQHQTRNLALPQPVILQEEVMKKMTKEEEVLDGREGKKEGRVLSRWYGSSHPSRDRATLWT